MVYHYAVLPEVGMLKFKQTFSDFIKVSQTCHQCHTDQAGDGERSSIFWIII